MLQRNLFNVCLLATIFVTACDTSNSKDHNKPDPLVTNRDTTVNPAQDFFHYADGGWFKAHPIPASERSNGIFRTIQDTINEQVKRICEESANANAAEGSNKQKIGDFFASGMDVLFIENYRIAK